MTRFRTAAATLSVAAPIFAAIPAFADQLGRAAEDDISLWRVASAFVLCVILAIAGAFLLKARGGNVPFLPTHLKRSQRLRLIETLRLGNNAAVSIVECDGRELLVVSTPQTCEIARDLSSPETRSDAKVAGAGR
jgi:flagellar biogenesis protein FliO